MNEPPDRPSPISTPPVSASCAWVVADRHQRRARGVQQAAGGQHAARAVAVGDPARDRLAEAPHEVLDRDRERERLAIPPAQLRQRVGEQAEARAHAEGDEADDAARDDDQRDVPAHGANRSTVSVRLIELGISGSTCVRPVHMARHGDLYENTVTGERAVVLRGDEAPELPDARASHRPPRRLRRRRAHPPGADRALQGHRGRAGDAHRRRRGHAARRRGGDRAARRQARLVERERRGRARAGRDLAAATRASSRRSRPASGWPTPAAPTPRAGRTCCRPR